MTCASLILRYTSLSKGFLIVIYSCKKNWFLETTVDFLIILAHTYVYFLHLQLFFAAFLLFVYSLVTNFRQTTIRLNRHEMTDFIRYIPYSYI